MYMYVRIKYIDIITSVNRLAARRLNENRPVVVGLQQQQRQRQQVDGGFLFRPVLFDICAQLGRVCRFRLSL